MQLCFWCRYTCACIRAHTYREIGLNIQSCPSCAAVYSQCLCLSVIQASSEHFARSVACYLYPELRQQLESEVGAQLHFVTFSFLMMLMLECLDGTWYYLTHICFLPTKIFPISCGRYLLKRTASSFPFHQFG